MGGGDGGGPRGGWGFVESHVGPLVSVEPVAEGFGGQHWVVHARSGRFFVTVTDVSRLAEKERAGAVAAVLANLGVPAPGLVALGTADVEGRPVGYVVRSHLEGRSYQELVDAPGQPTVHWDRLLGDLGDALGRLHVADTAGRVPAGAPGWSLQDVWARCAVRVRAVPPGRVCGSVTTDTLQALWADGHTRFGELAGDRTAPSLVHGDLRFANVVAGPTAGADRLAGLIDLGSVGAGLAEVDLVSLESRLVRADLGGASKGEPPWTAGIPAFRAAYRHRCERRTDPELRRLLHFLHSLGYLRVVLASAGEPGGPPAERQARAAAAHEAVVRTALSGGTFPAVL